MSLAQAAGPPGLRRFRPVGQPALFERRFALLSVSAATDSAALNLDAV